MDPSGRFVGYRTLPLLHWPPFSCYFLILKFDHSHHFHYVSLLQIPNSYLGPFQRVHLLSSNWFLRSSHPQLRYLNNLITLTFKNTHSPICQDCAVFSFLPTLPPTPGTTSLEDGDSDNRKRSQESFAYREKAPQLQTMPLFDHVFDPSQRTHAETYRRETFQVQSMYLFLHSR